jgi:hypothetical protein
VRIYLLGIFGHLLLKRKKITEKIEIKIQYLETYALIDVLWSSIPLGILTAYEMIYFSKFGGVQNSLELFKMIALAIDIIGIVYLVYFEVLGLEDKICGQNEHHDIHSIQEEDPLLQPQKSNTNS